MARGILSSLTEARDDMQQKLSEVEDGLSELNDLKDQLEENIDRVESAISVIEELDGLYITGEVEVTVDVSVTL